MLPLAQARRRNRQATQESLIVRAMHKQVLELLLLVPAFGLLIPPISSTNESYALFPGLAFAALAFCGSLGFALWRGAETWQAAVVKLLLFLAFGWLLHARIVTSV